MLLNTLVDNMFYYYNCIMIKLSILTFIILFVQYNFNICYHKTNSGSEGILKIIQESVSELNTQLVDINLLLQVRMYITILGILYNVIEFKSLIIQLFLTQMLLLVLKRLHIKCVKSKTTYIKYIFLNLLISISISVLICIIIFCKFILITRKCFPIISPHSTGNRWYIFFNTQWLVCSTDSSLVVIWFTNINCCLIIILYSICFVYFQSIMK